MLLIREPKFLSVDSVYLEQYILLINDFSWYVLNEKEIAQWAENCLESFTIEGIILKFVSAEDRSLFMLKWI